MRVTLVQALDRGRGGVTALHDDRAHGVAQRGGDRGLGTGVDLEQVDERADHAVDVGDVLDAGRGARLAQPEVERVGARLPARGLGFRGAPLLVDRAQLRVGRLDVVTARR